VLEDPEPLRHPFHRLVRTTVKPNCKFLAGPRPAKSSTQAVKLFPVVQRFQNKNRFKSHFIELKIPFILNIFQNLLRLNSKLEF
jgi:hypothetical protein